MLRTRVDGPPSINTDLSARQLIQRSLIHADITNHVGERRLTKVK